MYNSRESKCSPKNNERSYGAWLEMKDTMGDECSVGREWLRNLVSSPLSSEDRTYTSQCLVPGFSTGSG